MSVLQFPDLGLNFASSFLPFFPKKLWNREKRFPLHLIELISLYWWGIENSPLHWQQHHHHNNNNSNNRNYIANYNIKRNNIKSTKIECFWQILMHFFHQKNWTSTKSGNWKTFFVYDSSSLEFIQSCSCAKSSWHFFDTCWKSGVNPTNLFSS